MIRRVAESDYEALVELSKRAIQQSVTAAPAIKDEIVKDTQAHIEQGMSSADHIFLKCVSQDDAIQGFILLKNGWNLSDLFIEPDFHNQGLGRDLFVRALSILRARENRGYIRVNSSLNAEGFYRKLGFRDFTPGKPLPDFVKPLIYEFASDLPKEQDSEPPR